MTVSARFFVVGRCVWEIFFPFFYIKNNQNDAKTDGFEVMIHTGSSYRLVVSTEILHFDCYRRAYVLK